MDLKTMDHHSWIFLAPLFFTCHSLSGALCAVETSKNGLSEAEGGHPEGFRSASAFPLSGFKAQNRKSGGSFMFPNE